MALMTPPTYDKKRVKVYELKNNDWFDRGTGFCTGRIVNVRDEGVQGLRAPPLDSGQHVADLLGGDESRILVEAEDQPDRLLLETKISKDDGYQKQQDTLIVWTESNGTDMALSFQEAEGCAAIWDFVSQVQQHLLSLGGPDDALSDDAMEGFRENPAAAFVLPQPEISNLAEIENSMRSVASTTTGREALSRFVMNEDYIRKLTSLVEIAEDLESLKDLHILCNIMKLLILLNDSAVIEHVVNENVVFGVIGALECEDRPLLCSMTGNPSRYTH